MNATEKLLRTTNAIVNSGLLDHFSREFEVFRSDQGNRIFYEYSLKGDVARIYVDNDDLFRLIFLLGKMSDWDLVEVKHHQHRGRKSTITYSFRKDTEGMPLWRADEERNSHIVLDVQYETINPKLGYLSITGVAGVQ